MLPRTRRGPPRHPSPGRPTGFRDAVLIASPASSRSPEPGVTPRRTSVSPLLMPTRRRSGVAPMPSSSSASSATAGLRGRRVPGRPHARKGPEDPDDRVPDELLHDTAVGVDLCLGHRGVGREHPVDIFGIGRLRRRGEPDQVAEEGGDDLALLGDRTERRAPMVPHNRRRIAAPPGSTVSRKGRSSSNEPSRNHHEHDTMTACVRRRETLPGVRAPEVRLGVPRALPIPVASAI